jgi:hypothetical protein
VPKFVIKNPIVTINGVDLSNHCSQVQVTTTFASVNVTTFGDTYEEILQGMGTAQMVFNFFQDFDAGEVDATLWPLSQSGGTFICTVQPTSSPTSATNPKYTMTGVLLGYNPVDGAVGAASATQVTVPNASQAGLTRATS